MPYKKTGDAGNGGGAAPTNTDDFVFSKVIPFATDAGFVANRAPAPGTAPNREYWTHKGTVGSPAEPFIYIRTRDSNFWLMTGLGINLSEEIFDQPDNPCNGPASTAWGNPGNAGTGNNACPIFKGQTTAFAGHHLFTNAAGDYIHGVAQLGAREWRHFHFGKMPQANKYGTFVGGTYCYADWWDKSATEITDPSSAGHQGLCGAYGDNAVGRFHKGGFFHCEGLTAGIKWHGRQFATATSQSESVGKSVGNVNNSGYLIGTHYTLGAQRSFSGGLGSALQASLIARTVPLIPVTISIRTNFLGNVGQAVVGTLPDVFYVNMREFAAGETITIGSDSYVVFPYTNNDIVNTVNGDPYSGYLGLAYKIIP